MYDEDGHYRLFPSIADDECNEGRVCVCSMCGNDFFSDEGTYSEEDGFICDECQDRKKV